jgi:hypothetical protein
MAPLRMPTAGLGESERLLQRMRRLVREARGDNRAGGGPWLHAQRRELEHLRSELEESVKREVTEHDDGTESTQEDSDEHE